MRALGKAGPARYVHLMMTIQDIYAARVAAGTLEPDDAQQAVLAEFERIRAGLAQPVDLVEDRDKRHQANEKLRYLIFGNQSVPSQK